MERLKQKNIDIKNLKTILRSTRSSRISIMQLDGVLSESSTDRKAFIFLLDMFDTEREITKELLEDLIDNTVDFNELLMDYLVENESENTGNSFENILKSFNSDNIKNIIILAIAIGVVIGVAKSSDLTTKILETAIEVKKK